MDVVEGFGPSRLKSLPDRPGTIETPRDPWRVAHPLSEVLFLVVCATICECEDYDIISDRGEERFDFLRRCLPHELGAPGGRWLTILMNRSKPALFDAAFTVWVRDIWPEKPDSVAIDAKTSRRSLPKPRRSHRPEHSAGDRARQRAPPGPRLQARRGGRRPAPGNARGPASLGRTRDHSGFWQVSGRFPACFWQVSGRSPVSEGEPVDATAPARRASSWR